MRFPKEWDSCKVNRCEIHVMCLPMIVVCRYIYIYIYMGSIPLVPNRSTMDISGHGSNKLHQEKGCRPVVSLWWITRYAPLKRALNDLPYEVLKHLNKSKKTLETFHCTVYEFRSISSAATVTNASCHVVFLHEQNNYLVVWTQFSHQNGSFSQYFPRWK